MSERMLSFDGEEWKDHVVRYGGAAVVGLSISTARAETTAVPKQSAYPQVQDLPPKREQPGMTVDEQSKLKKESIDARDRQTSHVKAGESAARPKTKKP